MRSSPNTSTTLLAIRPSTSRRTKEHLPTTKSTTAEKIISSTTGKLTIPTKTGSSPKRGVQDQAKYSSDHPADPTPSAIKTHSTRRKNKPKS